MVKYFTYSFLIIIAFIAITKFSETSDKEYNKHMCATWGYYEDCKTKLPEELRLK